ncbi:MAG TPA: DUF4142 domain-containing protein [Gemmatimonadaceae bacterium]
MTTKTKGSLAGRVLATAVVAALVACQPADQAGRTDTMQAGGDVARPGAGATATAGSGASAMADLPDTDGGLISLVMTIDRSEVEAARLAQERSQNARVRAFASEMINDHSRHMRQLEQLAQNENIQGVTRLEAGGTTAGDTSARAGGDTGAAADTGARAGAPETGMMARLRSSHEQMMSDLRNARGATFDQTYIEGQVRAHDEALQLLQRMQGAADNAALQQQLASTAQVVERHLTEVRQLQQSLQSTTTPGDTGRAKGDTGRSR